MLVKIGASPSISSGRGRMTDAMTRWAALCGLGMILGVIQLILKHNGEMLVPLQFVLYAAGWACVIVGCLGIIREKGRWWK